MSITPFTSEVPLRVSSVPSLLPVPTFFRSVGIVRTYFILSLQLEGLVAHLANLSTFWVPESAQLTLASVGFVTVAVSQASVILSVILS